MTKVVVLGGWSDSSSPEIWRRIRICRWSRGHRRGPSAGDEGIGGGPWRSDGGLLRSRGGVRIWGP